MPERDELSTTLTRLRKVAGLTGAEAARQAGISQASVSRWESGKFVPTLGDVRALARVYGAAPADRRTMERLVADLRESPNPPARLTMRRAGNMQQRVGRIEQGSALIRAFQPVLFSGLLQTEDYARAVFSSGGDLTAEQVEAGVAARMDRPDVLDGSRTYVAVHTEGVLRWPLGSPEIMDDQLAHVIELSRRAGVRIGVIPSTRPVHVAPMHGFDVYDERAALVGTETATAFLSDPHDVAAYVKLFVDLEAAALFGDEAREVMEAMRLRYAAGTVAELG